MPVRISKNRVALENIPLNEAKGADIASASTVNLDSATGNLVHITGTTTITAITLSSGYERTAIFDGSLTLTHNATTLILPGNSNITTSVGDRAIFRGDGSGVRCISYVKASGEALASDFVLLQTTVASSVASVTIGSSALFTSTYKRYMTVGSNIHPATDNVEGMIRVSIAGSVKTDATYQYARLANSSDSGAFSGLNSQTATAFASLWAQSAGNASGRNAGFTVALDDPSATDNYKVIHCTSGSLATSGQIGDYYGVGYYGGALGAVDGIQFYYSSGNIASGTFKLYGLK